MKIITKTYILSEVANKYKRQYPYFEWKGNVKDRDTYNKLLKANTEKEIIDIVGLDWTKNICSECNQNVEILVELADFEHDGYYAVCKSCLQKAMDLFSAIKEK